MPKLRHRDADVRLIVAGTGGGKTTKCRQMLREHRGRAFIWDYKRDHEGVRLVTLSQLAKLGLRARTALRYVPTFIPPAQFEPKARDRAELWLAKQFELFCMIVWQVQQADSSVDCMVLVEELPKVTRAGAAPPWWQQIVELGRAYGFIVIGTTQRAAYVDLGFRGAANYVWCGVQRELPDARYMAQRLGVSHVEIMNLPPLTAFVTRNGKTVRETLRHNVT